VAMTTREQVSQSGAASREAVEEHREKLIVARQPFR